jgi:phosphoribosylaminoimidazolecarboxamide formyltransferase/IMP cyclohydrolase
MSKFALLSVSDKAGIVPFAQALVDQHGFTLLVHWRNCPFVKRENVPVTDVSEHTGFPEMMDGRVKTLHPKVHGGLLCLRDNPEHQEAAKTHGIGMIDLVVVNLYPFEETVARAGVTFEEAIEQIDIGGPSMLRSAAKNHRDVTVVCDPADYDRVLASMDLPIAERPSGGSWPKRSLPAPLPTIWRSVTTCRASPMMYRIWMRFPDFLPKWRSIPRRR